MKKWFFRFNVVGLICILAGITFIIFNIPLFMWLIMLGACLVAAGIYLCR